MRQNTWVVARVRQQPEIFCCSLTMRRACSLALLVQGTRRSLVNSQTWSALFCSRRASTRPGMVAFVPSAGQVDRDPDGEALVVDPAQVGQRFGVDVVGSGSGGGLREGGRLS